MTNFLKTANYEEVRDLNSLHLEIKYLSPRYTLEDSYTEENSRYNTLLSTLKLEDLGHVADIKSIKFSTKVSSTLIRIGQIDNKKIKEALYSQTIQFLEKELFDLYLANTQFILQKSSKFKNLIRKLLKIEDNLYLTKSENFLKVILKTIIEQKNENRLSDRIFIVAGSIVAARLLDYPQFVLNRDFTNHSMQLDNIGYLDISGGIQIFRSLHLDNNQILIGSTCNFNGEGFYLRKAESTFGNYVGAPTFEPIASASDEVTFVMNTKYILDKVGKSPYLDKVNLVAIEDYPKFSNLKKFIIKLFKLV